MGDIEELKSEYNSLLMRHTKAFVFLDNVNISLEEKEFYIPEYKSILDRLNTILRLLNDEGVRYRKVEVLGGFDI